MKARLAVLAIVSSLVVMAGCTRGGDQSSQDVTRKQTTEGTMSQPTDQQQPGTVMSPTPSDQNQPGAYNQPGTTTDQGSMGSGSMGSESSDTGGSGTDTGTSGSSSY